MMGLKLGRGMCEMRRANTALAVILALLVGAGVYYMYGTRMGVAAQSTREGDSVVCQIVLSNGSLFPYEYLEFIASPDPAAVIGTEGAGENVPMLAEKAAVVTLRLPEGARTELEIGYYVLGMRRTTKITIE
jgi:hypothetical protein